MSRRSTRRWPCASRYDAAQLRRRHRRRLIGIGALGIDFTNLAIVLGALSVGIAVGLQNIAKNVIPAYPDDGTADSRRAMVR